jgi:hypothetical protein
MSRRLTRWAAGLGAVVAALAASVRPIRAAEGPRLDRALTLSRPTR